MSLWCHCGVIMLSVDVPSIVLLSDITPANSNCASCGVVECRKVGNPAAIRQNPLIPTGLKPFCDESWGGAEVDHS